MKIIGRLRLPNAALLLPFVVIRLRQVILEVQKVPWDVNGAQQLLPHLV